jgi:hypothetical protein
MSVFFSILLALVVIFVLVMGLFFFVPFHAAVQGGYENGLSGSFRVTWLWGLVSVEYLFAEQMVRMTFARLKLLQKSVQPKGSSIEKPTREKKQKQPRKREILSNIPEMLRLMRRVFASLSLRGHAHATVGFNDPADTGMAAGAWYSAFEWLPVPVTFTPDFTRRVLSVSGWLRIRVWLAGLAIIMAGEFFSPAGRKFLRGMRGT